MNDALMAEVSRVVGECAGAVSLCWDPRPAGEFDSTQAATYVDGAIARLSSVLSAEEGRIRDDERRKVAQESGDDDGAMIREDELRILNEGLYELAETIKRETMAQFRKSHDELVRESLVKIAVQALADHWDDDTNEAFVRVVLDAVEPIIRADERSRTPIVYEMRLNNEGAK